MLSIAVFAHNEEKSIALCLASIRKGGLGPSDRVHVLINGCTDGTAEMVAQIAAEDPRVRPRLIDLGDKANAWNDYVHNVADESAAAHVLVDGDVLLEPGSLDAIRRAFAEHPEAIAVSGVPVGGRTATSWRARILREHGLPGNLYALRGDTLCRLRTLGFSLPVGLIGDDSLLLWLMRRDFAPAAAVDRRRIHPEAGAVFAYRSLPFHSLDGLRGLTRRQVRYALRDLQVWLLIRHLQRNGLAANPVFVEDLYPAAPVWGQLYAPYGLRPFKLRKLLFPYTWIRTRGTQSRPHAPTWRVNQG